VNRLPCGKRGQYTPQGITRACARAMKKAPGRMTGGFCWLEGESAPVQKHRGTGFAGPQVLPP